jgi:hypothetical protein
MRAQQHRVDVQRDRLRLRAGVPRTRAGSSPRRTDPAEQLLIDSLKHTVHARF